MIDQIVVCELDKTNFACSVFSFWVVMLNLGVVYFDQLLGAART